MCSHTGSTARGETREENVAVNSFDRSHKKKVLSRPRRRSVRCFPLRSHAKNVVLDIYNMPQPPLLYRHSVINMTQPASTASASQ